MNYKVGLTIFLLALLAACTGSYKHPVEQRPFPEAEVSDDVGGWWRVRFRKHWPEDVEDPPFYLDPLIAEQIIEPVLYQYQNRIILWRFHRRAFRDNAGSQFTFLFYSDAETAQAISKAIYENPLTENLSDLSFLDTVIYNDFSVNNSGDPGIQASSDPAWPEDVQKTWPYFIMGASVNWLALVNERSAVHLEQDKYSTHELVEKYKLIDEDINRLWLQNGMHAYLHHLNAIFSYQPLLIRY